MTATPDLPYADGRHVRRADVDPDIADLLSCWTGNWAASATRWR